MGKSDRAPRTGSPAHYVPRAEGRLRARFATQLRREGEPDIPFTLRNLSASGFMGECPKTVRAGSKVVLLLPFGGRAEADVRWALGGRIGCQLRTPLSRRQRAQVLAVTAKNFLLTWAGLQAVALAGVLAIWMVR